MSRGRPRPFAKLSIVELEAMYAASPEDLQIIEKLEYELSFRTTDRAARLRSKLGKGRSTLPSQPAKKAHAKAPPIRAGGAGKKDTSPREHVAVAKFLEIPTANIPPQDADVPTAANDPASLLACWTALEALSPQTYRRPEDRAGGDRRRIADLSAGDIPWTVRERSHRNKQLFYEIYLGAIDMGRANERLAHAFGFDDERSSRAREKAALGTLLVDRDGCLLEENAVSLSSFGWALPLALQLRLTELGSWPSLESKLIERLDDLVRRVDDHNEPVPLDAATIQRAHDWILQAFGIPANMVDSPAFAVRIYHYFKAANPPETSLLNSFFLGDLARAKTGLTEGRLPAGLKSYLGMTVPDIIFDLQKSRAALEVAVSPALMPMARWPSPAGHPLVLLQQAAVNLARHELRDEGLIAVNGPPGTGKTTLLRDIITASILDRALAMARFGDPNDAFTPSGKKMSAGANAYFHLYRLASSLRGHEIVVASSNNKAVENVSRELPGDWAIRPDACSYFQSISDFLHGPDDFEQGEEASEDQDSEPFETWGLISAVLGNARNRFRFSRRFWWHEDRGFRIYLRAAKGDSVIREIKNPESGKVIKRVTPSVVTFERPPPPQAAIANWNRARNKLTALHREVEAELKAIEAVRQRCLLLAKTKLQLTRTESILSRLRAAHSKAEESKEDAWRPRDNAQVGFDTCATALRNHWLGRPGFLARLFGTQSTREWRRIKANLSAGQMTAEKQLGAAVAAYQAAERAVSLARADVQAAEQERDFATAEITRLAEAIEAHRLLLGDRIVDDSFFAKGHAETNLSAPWLPDSLHRKREELFTLAMDAHRAFIDAAAQKILHNISVLMATFSGGPPKDEAKRQLLGEMWSTLFLVVPVMSTTFASMEAMFGELAQGDIGWLLIDEAGQALPQAAVGALLRARRAVVVGDPLQIPPVVSLPERLNSEICRYFNVDKPLWAAPEASAQAVADRASRFRGSFNSDGEVRKVGIPLLVHRRCQEPMFGFSNEIAYDGQMVQAAGLPDPGPIGLSLGQSAWIDVDGEAPSKWCPEEGETVVRLLQIIADASVVTPDLFIITPFRIVAQELRRRLQTETMLFATFGVDARDWLNDRVGTIHTVQGREADTVILVLGAPASVQGGARSWAAGTPNIFNVAVSRAKQNLYIVGSRGAWSGVGHASTLSRLPGMTM